jgi:hypothetical protein
MELPLRKLLAVVLCCIMQFSASEVIACSVCFGDPSSDMAKGVNAGIAVLLGLIVTVLISIVAVMSFWIHRARRFARLSPSVGIESK